MKIQLSHNNSNYQCDLKSPLDISIPIKSGEINPSCFWAEPVQYEVIKSGDFIGSVAEGGNVNYKKVTITPHGNGTHTECYGHISADEDATISNCHKISHSIAFLMSLPLSKKENGDNYISFNNFINALEIINVNAIIIRTLPNEKDKLTKQYSGTNPPYLDSKITKYMSDNNIEHLLVDLPSVDKEVDGGALAAHKNFWNLTGEIRKHSTITELIFVDNSIKDGLYLLNIQIPNMAIDAVPSKPVLYKMELMQ